ncbi:MAG TPA: hypothetical protein VFV76_08870 [Actinomycetes bacterium]|nr:hypothetical protein [Actinomycetes bacterium]
MRWWKVLGLAGVVGVAATGAVVARAERRRRAYTADEVRERLHARHADAATTSQADGRKDPGEPPESA